MGAAVETSHPAGWQPDPFARYQYRYWDGTAWTDQVSTNGTHETDPLGLAPGPRVATPNQLSGRALQRPDWPLPIRVLVVGGSALLALGSFLPWARAEAGPFTATKDGLDGDGVLTLVLSVAIALLFFLVRKPKVMAWVVIGLGVLAAAIALIDIADVSNRADDLSGRDLGMTASVSVGIGLWLALVGAVVAIVGGIVALVRGPDDA